MSRLGNPPPGIQIAGSRYAVRRRIGNRGTVLGGKGPLRRDKTRHALAFCAPFRPDLLATDGSAGNQLRHSLFDLRNQENQVVVDKTS
jgi:hypothetical protein